jgi:hypothetical protein
VDAAPVDMVVVTVVTTKELGSFEVSNVVFLLLG